MKLYALAEQNSKPPFWRCEGKHSFVFEEDAQKKQLEFFVFCKKELGSFDL